MRKSCFDEFFMMIQASCYLTVSYYIEISMRLNRPTLSVLCFLSLKGRERKHQDIDVTGKRIGF